MNPLCHKHSDRMIELIGPCTCPDCALTSDSIVTWNMEYLMETEWYDFPDSTIGQPIRTSTAWTCCEGMLAIRYKSWPNYICVIDKEKT